MSRNHTEMLLRKLMFHKSGKTRLWTAWIALCAGLILLFSAVMIWWNFRELLAGRGTNDSLGSTFITINKKITDENRIQPAGNFFTEPEIEDLRKAPQVQDVGMLESNHFPVAASMGSGLRFYTQLFLESVPERFIDKKPKDWHWQDGDFQVPIIVSTEFLNLYNYGFAPSQGLPQLSEQMIQTLGFDLTIGGNIQEKYSGHIVGFSDRITSVLVPESFLKYANAKFGDNNSVRASRLILKTKDPSDKAFEKYLTDHNYTTNTEQLRWNKLRAIVETITGATGVLAILLIGISSLVFILFIELSLAKASEAVKLLLQLGYRPSYLSRFISRRFLPFILSAVLIGVMIAALLQFGCYIWVQKMDLQLSILPGWPIWVVALLALIVLMAQMKKTIRKSISDF